MELSESMLLAHVLIRAASLSSAAVNNPRRIAAPFSRSQGQPGRIARERGQPVVSPDASTMSNRASSVPEPPEAGTKSTIKRSRCFGSRIPFSSPSRAFSFAPATYICVINGSAPGAVTAKWMCGAPARIGYGPDGAKSVTAVGAGGETAVALKILVQRHVAPVPGVVVVAIGITLPDLDLRTGYRAPSTVKHLAGEVRNHAFGEAGTFPDANQIVVRIQRQFERIKKVPGSGAECAAGPPPWPAPSPGRTAPGCLPPASGGAP